MMFSRTSAGKAAKFLFYRETIVWVEGDKDVVFYEKLLRKRRSRIEPAGGREEIEKLAEALQRNGYPYVVIRDGDYDILFRSRSSHRRVIYLNRYACENYLLEVSIIEHVCCNLCQVSTGERISQQDLDLLQRAIEQLRPLIILDVAHQLSNTGQKVLPDNIHALLVDQRTLSVSEARLDEFLDNALKNIDPVLIDHASDVMDNFTLNRNLAHIVRGHLLFSALRFVIMSTVQRRRRRRPNVDDNTLRAMLAAEVWDLRGSWDHINLARRIKNALREATNIRDDFGGGTAPTVS